MTSILEDVVKESLKTVVDPEIGINIVDLGLIYDINIQDENVSVNMTLTSPACPIGPVIQAQVNQTIKKLPWVKEVKVNLVWSPRWDPKVMASEDARLELGIY